jgi:hypothetical protein
VNDRKKDRKHDPRLEARAKQLFDSSVAGLDARTRSKLAQARARAADLGKRRDTATWRPDPRWLPAGVAAAATVAALLVWRGFDTRPPAIEILAFDDLEIVLGEDEFEMLEELEFYAWLEEQPELEIPEPADDGVG